MLKMITVDRFLCLELEVGGLVIGWIGVVWPIFDFLYSFYLYLSGTVIVDAPVKIIIIFYLNFGAVFLGFSIFSYKCVQGVKTGNPALLIPIMVWLALYGFFSFTFIFMFTWEFLVNALIFVPICSYFLIVIYSIYVKFTRNLSQTKPVSV